ncbi:hypothetical protein V7x_28860 [Crateriforma conspicua]|uniref:Uncharacterized protein n=1 Tax=Crateriforma conspicua TaxID=2527996 RepID=A0A5C6FW16_9PLAN|nr:hypothetical protein [Crateriforma conspicua]TWU67312.1 hypothetical protein V7x_28860 [Crateriforma conspicua]
MAVQYRITEARDSGDMSVTKSDDSIQFVIPAVFNVEVFDPADPSFDGRSIDRWDAASAVDSFTGRRIPTVGVSVYYFDGKVIPFLTCTSKRCVRNKDVANRFTITCKFDSGKIAGGTESDAQKQDPPDDLTDLTPRVEPYFGEDKKILHVDYNDREVLLPNGNPFSEPLEERISTLGLKITQYEPFLSYEDADARRFKVNSDTFRGDDPYKWIIDDVSPKEVEVVLSSGTVDAVEVTYSLLRNPTLYGWMDRRALIDVEYLDDDGNRVAFTTDDAFGSSMGLLTVTGEKKSGTEPDYLNFEPQPRIEFGSFLQVS